MSVACDTLHSDAAAAACVRRDSADSWSTVATGHNCFVTLLRYILFKAQMSGLGLMSELGSLHIKIVLGAESMRTCCALQALVHERYSSAATAACVRRDGGDAWGIATRARTLRVLG